jgi:hypothetical protein
VALLGAVVFAIDAQQEPGAPAALRSMLAPAASVAAAVLTHTQQQKLPPRLALSGEAAQLPAAKQMAAAAAVVQVGSMWAALGILSAWACLATTAV